MKIDLLTADDWVAVYKDGTKVWENHSCPLAEGLTALGIDFEEREVSSAHPEFYTGEEFPDEL